MKTFTPRLPRMRLAKALVAATMVLAGGVAAQSEDVPVPDTSGAVANLRGVVVSSDERPGVGRNPAFVCLQTTLTDQGHTRQTTVIRKSGNPTSDRNAMRAMQIMKIKDQEGVPHVERDIRVLVKMYANGQFAYQFFEMYETLPDICMAPPWERKRKR